MREKLEVKIKKLHEDAVLPKYATEGDAGVDLTAVDVKWDPELGSFEYSTGLALEIPKGYVGLIYPRSSIRKYDLMLTNSVGVIDSGYRGEIRLVFKPTYDYWCEAKSDSFYEMVQLGRFKYYQTAEEEVRKLENIKPIYAIGDRIGQLIIVPYPEISFKPVKELSDTERGEGGFGSTGK